MTAPLPRSFPPCHPPLIPLASAPNPTASTMSKHSSLKATGSAAGKRSVLKRFERIKLMRERDQWKKGMSPTGLPKTKHAD